MTTRRQTLTMLGVAGLLVAGYSRISGKRIEDMPREYALLMDPEQRRAALGDQRLRIRGADVGIGETDFYTKEWENVHFYDCIFYGVIHLSRIRNCVFEHCQFPGTNFQASSIEDVLFVRSDTLGRAYVMAGTISKNVRFVECDFGGKNPNVNRYGSVYFMGDVSYESCTGQYMDISGNGTVSYRDCKFGPVSIKNGTYTNGKKIRATVLVDNCKFKGRTEIARSSLTSLTIRNSKFDVLNIGLADVQGDVLIEGVEAGAMIREFDIARSITIRNSRFRGVNIRPPDLYPKIYRSLDCDVDKDNRHYLRSVVLENVECGRDEGRTYTGARENMVKTITGCKIQGGIDSTILRNCKMPLAKFELRSANATFENYEGDTASFATSKIGTLNFRTTAIVKTIDFTDVQVQKLDAKGLIRFTGQKIVTTGSNVYLP